MTKKSGAERDQLAEKLRRCEAESEQLQRWLEAVLSLSEASFKSARWRVGDGIIRIIEIFLRRRPRLARDAITDIGRLYAQWCHRRMHNSGVEPSQSTGPVMALSSQRQFPPREQGCLDIIIFPIIDWHFRIQRPQHLARELAAAGHRVFYLSTQYETRADANEFSWFETPEPGVYLVKLRIKNRRAHNLYNDNLQERDLDYLRPALYALADHAQILAPVALVDLPFWRPLAESIPSTIIIYDCMDHHAGFSTNSKNMLSQEDVLVDAADIILTTSSFLHQKICKKRHSHLIRNAAQVERFRDAGMRFQHRSGPVRVGYVGAIAEWFDFELVIAAAKALPEFEFEMVGAVTDIDIRRAKVCPNLHFRGEIPYSELADQIAQFDVCIIPFLLTSLTEATNPVKVYEYLAAGRPVVATPLPELRTCLPFVRLASGNDDFVAALREAAEERGDTLLAEQRMRWASKHDWSRRAADLISAIAKRQPKVSVIVLCWNNRHLTEDCLSSLEHHTDYADWELILVDNASRDGTPELLMDYAAQRAHVTVVLNDTNIGFAAGNNLGVRHATGEIIIFLNNDTYVTSGWMHGLVGHLLRNPKLGAVGPITNNIGNEAKVSTMYSNVDQMVDEAKRLTRGNSRRLFSVDVLAFFCVAVRAQAIEKVGPLDERFGQGFFEDDDYCRRLTENGFEMAIAEDVFVHHHLSGSFESLSQEERQALFERNKTHYERKWGTWRPHKHRR